MNRLPLSYTALLALLLSGCVSLPEDGTEVSKGVQAPAQTVDPAPSTSPSDLEPEVVFDVLVGEIAGRRRDFTTAFVHLHRAAQRSRDPEIAERAARLGIYAPEVPQALEAAELWASLQPDNIQARQLALLHLQLSLASDLDLPVMLHCRQAFEPLPFFDESDLVEKLEPGVGGLLIRGRGHGGTFLPAVWEKVDSPQTFVRALKRKAGLQLDDDLRGLKAFRYHVEEF